MALAPLLIAIGNAYNRFASIEILDLTDAGVHRL